MTATGEEEEVGGATAFGRQGATSAVRRRVALDYTTLASYRPDMYEGPRNSEYSRDVHNLSNTGFYPRSKQKISLSLSLFPQRQPLKVCLDCGEEVGLGGRCGRLRVDSV